MSLFYYTLLYTIFYYIGLYRDFLQDFCGTLLCGIILKGEWMLNFYKEYNITLNDCLLKELTSDVNDFELSEVGTFLRYGYSSNDPNESKIVTLINAIFTHHSQTFMLTKKSYVDLIEKDTNSKYKSLNSLEYKNLIRIMLTSGHFERIREPIGRKAGVYKLVCPDILDVLHKLHSAEFFKMQEEKVTAYYDGAKVESSLSMREMAERDGLL